MDFSAQKKRSVPLRHHVFQMAMFFKIVNSWQDIFSLFLTEGSLRKSTSSSVHICSVCFSSSLEWHKFQTVFVLNLQLLGTFSSEPVFYVSVLLNPQRTVGVSEKPKAVCIFCVKKTQIQLLCQCCLFWWTIFRTSKSNW